jgi:hypothetical protein
MEGSSVGTKCPKCAADVAAGEKFCAACGAGIVVVDGAVRVQDAPPEVVGLGHERDARIGRARKWLMAISIITLVSGFIFYAIGKDDVEKQIRDGEMQMSAVDPELRDARLKEQFGMTWEQIKAHDRGQVNLLLFINIGLAIAYFGMWFWAKRNPLAAAVTALLLFITVIVVNGVFDPKSIPQGFLIKILFIAALAKAISAAQEERKLDNRIPAAKLQ